MKALSTLIVGALLVTSCGSTGSGAFSGAMLGGVIGSCIGGIGGGPRGSDIGTLIGMAGGAAAGAAIATAAEQQQTRAYNASQSSYDSYSTDVYSDADPSGRSDKPVYDDVITMGDAGQQQQPSATQKYATNIRIENVRFVNNDNTTHISKGELVKISFEVRNVTNSSWTNIVPRVEETTGNKRLLISPSTMIESLAPHKAIRYTAFISAQKNLKTGTAHFRLSVLSNGAVMSNVEEFDIPLE